MKRRRLSASLGPRLAMPLAFLVGLGAAAAAGWMLLSAPGVVPAPQRAEPGEEPEAHDGHADHIRSEDRARLEAILAEADAAQPVERVDQSGGSTVDQPGGSTP